MKNQGKKQPYTHVTAHDVNQIRLLLDADLKIQDVMRVTKRSHFVVAAIKHNGIRTFEEYKYFIKAHLEKYGLNSRVAEEKKPEPVPEPTTEPVKEPEIKPETVMGLLKSIDASLKELVQLKREAITYARNRRMSAATRGFDIHSFFKRGNGGGGESI